MIRTFLLAALAAGPAMAHSGHGGPASHTHLEEVALVAVAAIVTFAVIRFRRTR